MQAKILNGEEGIYFSTYSDRRPTGDAFVLFVDDDAANRALTRHRNYLGQRYVELFKASPSEQVQVSILGIIFIVSLLKFILSTYYIAVDGLIFD